MLRQLTQSIRGCIISSMNIVDMTYRPRYFMLTERDRPYLLYVHTSSLNVFLGYRFRVSEKELKSALEENTRIKCAIEKLAKKETDQILRQMKDKTNNFY